MKQIILFVFILFLSSFQLDKTVKVFGFFSNEKSTDGEHSKGYTLHLWEYNSQLIGTVSFNEGLIGDQLVNVIEKVRYSKSTGEISFSSSFDDQTIAFKGKAFKSKVTGSFTWSDRTDNNQILNSCCKDAPIYKNYKSYQEWQKMLNQIL